MHLKLIGIFVASVIGFLALAILGAAYAPRFITGEPSKTNAPIASQEPRATQMIKVYFGNSERNPAAMDCGLVFPVERRIEKTPAVGRAALIELFKGPTLTEKIGGYYTLLNNGVKIKNLSIKDGIAYADFDSKMEEGMGGSCRVAAVRAQITQTLKQFPSVSSVVISVDGRVEDALQP